MTVIFFVSVARPLKSYFVVLLLECFFFNPYTTIILTRNPVVFVWFKQISRTREKISPHVVSRSTRGVLGGERGTFSVFFGPSFRSETLFYTTCTHAVVPSPSARASSIRSLRLPASVPWFKLDTFRRCRPRFVSWPPSKMYKKKNTESPGPSSLASQ